VINAGYIQADVRITSKFQIRFGVRAEQTKNALTEFDPRTRAEVLAAGYAADAVGTNNGRATTIPGLQYQFESKSKVVRRKTYTNWFPSIVAKYQILPELEWQAGVNKGISRPGIDDLTGLRNVNESNFTVNSPNPNLLPEYHKVYQTRLAYYFGNKSPGQVSIAYIVDEAENFTLTRNLSASEFGETDPDFAPYTFITKINDPLLQRYKNLDFNYQQTLGFLPSIYLKGLGVGATYSRSYANQRRNFLAPHRATASLSYTYKRFSGRVGGIWIDDRPVDSVYGRVWGAMTKLDISATWKLTRYASLYVQVRNPTNQKDLYYESPPGTQEGKGKVLRRMEAYGDNWVFGVKGSF
jgi:iron complex outermembrane receptor protein